MINRIKSHQILAKFLEDKCCENQMSVVFDEKIQNNSFVIIKVDKYYNAQNMPKTPASIDCLIVQECINTGYGLTLIELKNIQNIKGFDIENIKEKFETTLNDFIKVRFKDILDRTYIKIDLFFVSKQEIYKRDLGLKMDMLINLKFKFNDRKLMIQPKMPIPAIKNCYS